MYTVMATIIIITVSIYPQGPHRRGEPVPRRAEALRPHPAQAPRRARRAGGPGRRRHRHPEPEAGPAKKTEALSKPKT